MNATNEKCACGLPLHYQDPQLQKIVQNFVDVLGPTIRIDFAQRTYLVPRHFIALHGLKSRDLPMLVAEGIAELALNESQP